MVGTLLVVLVVAHGTSEPLTTAFQQAALGALGAEARLDMRTIAEAPPDSEASALAGSADGLVELSWEAGVTKARLHCYLSRERRWVDREIAFGNAELRSEGEAGERGRLLGFAAATMFGQAEHATPVAPRPLEAMAVKRAPVEPASSTTRRFEFLGTVSSGIEGTASGLGADIGARLLLEGPLSGRLFVAGRGGSIPAAQATTRSAFFGGGLALAVHPAHGPVELGLRADAFVSYFEATHFSADDLDPDRRSRWLPGADLVAEGGVRLVGSAGVFLGVGVEALTGKTAIYTHGRQVALVPTFRALAQLGVGVGF